MNIKRLQLIQEIIKKDINDFTAQYWDLTYLKNNSELKKRILSKNKNKECKCIAGWACYLFDESRPLILTEGEEYEYFEFKGREILGLTEDEADKLFYQINEQNCLQILDEYINSSNLNEV